MASLATLVSAASVSWMLLSTQSIAVAHAQVASASSSAPSTSAASAKPSADPATEKSDPTHGDDGAEAAKPCPECEEAERARARAYWHEKAGVVGLRASYTRVRGTGSTDNWGLTFAGGTEEYATHHGIARHDSVFWGIGGGSAAFEGALGTKIALGVRLPAGVDQGPVLRIGMQGWLQGNGALYSSLLELPLAQLGYQFIRGRTVIELGVQSGPVLVGRFRPEDGHRKLGGTFEGTIYGALHFSRVRLDASVMRVETKDPIGSGHAPIDFIRATLCMLGSPIGLCADAWSYHGSVAVSAPSGQTAIEAHALYLGLLVGVSEH